jgi:hypothetical protein
MKIRHSIIWFTAIVVALIALLLWYWGEKPGEKSTMFSTQTNETLSIASTTSALVSSVAVHTNVPMPQTTNGGDLSKAPRLSQQERAIGLLSTYNDIPIIFYGQLQDQFSNGVPSAVVDFSVQVINGHENTTKRGQVVSDSNGFFTISPGYKGQNLALVPQKVGYVLATTGTLFWFSHLEEHPYEPDPDNPTVIRMWKLQGAEPLVQINKTFKLPYTGEPIFFDLLTGNVVPAGGDLEVIVTRAPGVITQRREDHGDWSIKLVPVNGGITETDYHTAQVTFEAPADGYQDSYFVQMSHDDPGWYDNIQKVFFLMSRNGQVYSKFSFDFGINDDPNSTMWFQFKGVANANSSRNWEATVPQ